MRSLTPVYLAQLADEPAAPPDGYTMIYPRGDGTLQVHGGDTLGMLPVWAVGRPAGDVLMDSRDWVDVISIPVQAGLYQVRGVIALSDEPGVWPRLRFAGPAADLIALTCVQVTIVGGAIQDVSQDFVVGYGQTIDLGGADAGEYQARIEGSISVAAPGMLRLQAQAGAYKDAQFTDGIDDAPGVGGGTGIEIDPLVGHLTPGSLKIVVPFDGEPWASNVFIAVVPGIPLHIRYWAMSPTGGTIAEIRALWGDEDFSQVGDPESVQVTLDADVWTQITLDTTVPAGAASCDIYLGVGGSPAEGTVLYLDEILIERPGGEATIAGASLLMVSPV
ncbi:hypothetical protein [Nonomuraea glycinis]|uniref:hypothetical protein n=1 Tax=Nonomuraea glycinis TaxID=2047744 RepID=UPI0033B4CC21